MWALGDKIASTIVAQTLQIPTLPWSGSGKAPRLHGVETASWLSLAGVSSPHAGVCSSTCFCLKKIKYYTGGLVQLHCSQLRKCEKSTKETEVLHDPMTQRRIEDVYFFRLLLWT